LLRLLSFVAKHELDATLDKNFGDLPPSSRKPGTMFVDDAVADLATICYGTVHDIAKGE